MNEYEEREIRRTPSYIVLRRSIGNALFGQLLDQRAKIERTQRLATSLREQLSDVDNLLTLALHELAAKEGKEPHHFARDWKRRKEEARVAA